MTFDEVAACGLSLPHVELSTKYDGSPVLKVHGSFMAGLAMHESAEPGTLVVRYGIGDRDHLIEDAGETYYLTDYYRPYPLVLARLAMLRAEALPDLLLVSWQMAVEKAGKPQQ